MSEFSPFDGSDQSEITRETQEPETPHLSRNGISAMQGGEVVQPDSSVIPTEQSEIQDAGQETQEETQQEQQTLAQKPTSQEEFPPTPRQYMTQRGISAMQGFSEESK